MHERVYVLLVLFFFFFFNKIVFMPRVILLIEITNFPGRRRLPAASPSLKGEKPFTSVSVN